MIQLIVGGKGSGKTKKMIDMINASAKTTPGNIVCIEKSMKLTYDIDHSARLIDVDEYGIDGYDMLYGFVAGVLAGNYDIVEAVSYTHLLCAQRPCFLQIRPASRPESPR